MWNYRFSKKVSKSLNLLVGLSDRMGDFSSILFPLPLISNKSAAFCKVMKGKLYIYGSGAYLQPNAYEALVGKVTTLTGQVTDQTDRHNTQNYTQHALYRHCCTNLFKSLAQLSTAPECRTFPLHGMLTEWLATVMPQE